MRIKIKQNHLDEFKINENIVIGDHTDSLDGGSKEHKGIVVGFDGSYVIVETEFMYLSEDYYVSIRKESYYEFKIEEY